MKEGGKGSRGTDLTVVVFLLGYLQKDSKNIDTGIFLCQIILAFHFQQ